MNISGIDLKLVAAVTASLIGISAYIPYLKEMCAGTNRPHLYTWLIWTLTTGTASAGLWYGGGGWAAISATVSATLTFIFFLLSFKYGTKNITKSDGVVLALALISIGVWWQLHQPVLAVILVSLIDASAYIPTYRKSWEEPWSESLASWVIWIAYGCCLILALKNYNWLTLTFVLMTTLFANFVLIAILLFRRRAVPKPAL